MCDKTGLELCRLCLNSRGLLINVFGENSELEFMLKKTVEDLIDVKVVEDANHPWLVCSTCMEKLTEFRLFKRRCAECLYVFYNRIQKGCNPATKAWVPNREEFPCEIKKENNNDAIASDAVDGSGVDVRDDMIVAKEKIDTAIGYSVAPEKDVDWPMITSMQEGCSHWSDKEEARIIQDPLEDGELRLSLNEEVVIKEEWDVDIPREEGCLGADLLQEQGGDMGQDGLGNILHKCQCCNKGFAQKAILEAHVMLLHPVKEEEIRSGINADALECTSDVEADAMTYKCAICLKAFSQKCKLKRHMLTHAEERPHKCEICAKTFNRKQHLKDHIRRHMREKSYKCEVCSRAFTLKKKLMEHWLRHSGVGPHKCEECSKEFSKKAHLERHMLTHADERPYRCEICLKGFNRKLHLEGHMLGHTGERPHKCEVCAKTFTLKQSLKVHMIIHSGKKPHRCEVCSKAFTAKQHLVEHGLTHSGEKPHKCELCPKAFSLKPNLKRHVLTTHGGAVGEGPLVKCGMCSKEFDRKLHLDRHMLSHHGEEKPHKCGVCPMMFTLKHHLEDHIHVHAGEKSRKKEVRSKEFRHKHYIKKHVSNHKERPHLCLICSRTFTHRSSLHRHMKVHIDTSTMRINDTTITNAESLPSGTNSA